MTVLVGAASFFVGNSYQAQMPNFAQDLGHGDPGTAYSMLLAADAAGALAAGIALETSRLMQASPRTALMLAIVWCAALSGFALVGNYALALLLLFTAGFFELSFSSMAQTLVQMNAPVTMRGRVIGLFNMSALGMRAFSGITVGLAGSLVGVHASLATSAAVMLLVAFGLLIRARVRSGASGSS
jgi:MFS family permease